MDHTHVQPQDKVEMPKKKWLQIKSDPILVRRTVYSAHPTYLQVGRSSVLAYVECLDLDEVNGTQFIESSMLKGLELRYCQDGQRRFLVASFDVEKAGILKRGVKLGSVILKKERLIAVQGVVRRRRT